MNAEADKQKKDRIEALNQADSTIYQTEKTLNELGDKVSADDKSQIESAIAELKAVKEKESASRHPPGYPAAFSRKGIVSPAKAISLF